ncbi:MAG: adenylate/guanylate cyclase domain-containing protein [Bacteroidota bacterium]
MKRRRNLKHLLKYIWQSVLFWTFAFFSFAVFRFFGAEESLLFSNPSEASRPSTFVLPVIIASTIGLGLGILYGLVDFIYEKYILKKVSIGQGIFLNVLFHFVVTIFVFTTGITFFSQVITPLNFEFRPGWWVTNKGFWAAMWYIVICSLVFMFIKMATERFGRGVFMKMLMGQYKNPKEEERIFMFLDLKDSTTIAEQLGHRSYSYLIQDAFHDLNEVVLDYDAEIYQYVGDEVVLCWPYQKGLKDNNCLGVFFAFEAQRMAKNDYYMKTYGVFPQFKAGLHGGTLIAAEVGFVKKELAYHGDVINTSARIQAECNRHNVTLLISGKLLRDLQEDTESEAKFLGSVLLKGKQKEVKIHSVVRTP